MFSGKGYHPWSVSAPAPTVAETFPTYRTHQRQPHASFLLRVTYMNTLLILFFLFINSILIHFLFFLFLSNDIRNSLRGDVCRAPQISAPPAHCHAAAVDILSVGIGGIWCHFSGLAERVCVSGGLSWV